MRITFIGQRPGCRKTLNMMAWANSKKDTKPSASGFTLIEIIAVLVVLSLLAALTIPRFVDLSQNASRQALASAVSQLNSREVLTWTNVKFSDIGWVDDSQVFSKVDTDLGSEYRWSPRARINGAVLHFRELSARLDRQPSTSGASGRWQVN
jgi:prepilin-type N-terminal cleavage/methylation domain-containing protein